MSTITIPAPLVGHARSGAHTTLGHAAEAILAATARPDRERNPSCYCEPLQQLDRARALLDAIGWRSTEGVAVHADERRHSRALLDALREQLGVYPEDNALAAFTSALSGLGT